MKSIQSIPSIGETKMRHTALITLALCTVASAAFAEPKYGPQSKEEAAKLVAVVKSADADLHAKFEACRNLAVIGSPDIVVELAPLLADEKLSHMIRYALEPIPGPAVDDAFRDAIGKAKGLALVGVVNSIGVRRDAKAVPALVALLKDADDKVACAAAGSLGRIADAPAAAALADALASTKDGDLRRAVIDGYLDVAGQLAEVGKAAAAAIYTRLRSPDAPSYVRVAATVGLLNCDPAGAGDLIFAALADKDPVVRGTVIARAATAKGDGITTRLTAALDKLPADTQVLLINALADRGDKAATPALTQAASRESADVRQAAIRALGKVGDLACVDLLCKAAASGQEADQQAAAGSLTLLGGEGVDAAIIKAVKAAEPQPRALLISVLADRKAAAATPELISLARDKDAGVQVAAIKALGRLAAPADLPALVQILIAAEGDAPKAEAQRTIVLVSRRIPDQAAQADAVLAALAAAKTPAARTALIQAVGGIGGEKAFQAVKAALADSDPAVNDAAIRALADWPDPQAVDAILNLLAKTKDNVHRVLLLRGTVRLLGLAGRPAAQTIATYKDLLAKTDSPADKKLVLAGLGAMDDPAALKVVEPMLAERDVKAEAELAMVNIAARVMGTAGDEAAAAARKVIAQTANDGVKRQAQTILNKLNRLKKGRK
jgi:HEAT repeat protein